MIGKLLKAKNWQIFILIFGLPFLIQMILVLFSTKSNFPEVWIKFAPWLIILYMTGFLTWLWSAAIGLQSKIPSGIKMRVKKFKILFFIPIIYIPVVLVFMQSLPRGTTRIGNELSGIIAGGFFSVIFILHILSIFGILYSIYFAAKTFKTAELQREVKYSELTLELFLFWFFPLGIWIIQPKINKIMKLER